MTIVGVMFAHQGGWDEVLLILTPVALFTALLWLANRRANAGLGRTEPDEPGARPSTPPSTTGPGDPRPPPGPDEGTATNP